MDVLGNIVVRWPSHGRSTGYLGGLTSFVLADPEWSHDNQSCPCISGFAVARVAVPSSLGVCLTETRVLVLNLRCWRSVRLHFGCGSVGHSNLR